MFDSLGYARGSRFFQTGARSPVPAEVVRNHAVSIRLRTQLIPVNQPPKPASRSSSPEAKSMDSRTSALSTWEVTAQRSTTWASSEWIAGVRATPRGSSTRRPRFHVTFRTCRAGWRTSSSDVSAPDWRRHWPDDSEVLLLTRQSRCPHDCPSELPKRGFRANRSQVV